MQIHFCDLLIKQTPVLINRIIHAEHLPSYLATAAAAACAAVAHQEKKKREKIRTDK